MYIKKSSLRFLYWSVAWVVKVTWAWNYCQEDSLEDCIEGTWYEGWSPYSLEPYASVTMVDCDCDPIVQTLNFEENVYDLNGFWYYDFNDRSYRLDNTENANNITLHWPNEGMWIIQVFEDEYESETIMRCTLANLKDCSGRWYHFDDANRWYPTSGSVRMYTDCTLDSSEDTECDITGITVNDTNCMLKTLSVLGHCQ